MSGSISSIQQFYGNILERIVDPAGLAGFTNQASTGTTLGAIENQIATSPEAATFVTPIVQLYEGILGRNPDQVGLNFWVNLYRGGKANLTQIANAFTTTPEGAKVLGTTVSTDSVTALYKTSLGRTPTTDEVKGWINTGLPLAQVSASIATSAEATVNLAAASLSYLIAAGQVQQTSSGQTITINGQQPTYTGTPGNDIFLAPVTQASLTGFPLASLLSNTVINGVGGNDVLQAGVTGGTVAPTLTGIQTVQVTGSPGINVGNFGVLGTNVGKQVFDLANTNGVTETDLINSAGTAVDYNNAVTVTGASLVNSNGGFLTVNSFGGAPVATVSVTGSNLGGIAITNDTSPTLTATVTNSPGAVVAVVSKVPTTGLTTFTVNTTATSSSTALAPDAVLLNDTDGVLKNLVINDTVSGFERVFQLGAGTIGASTVTIGNGGTLATGATGQLSIFNPFTKASTVDASGFAGSLQSGTASTSLAAAEGATIPIAYAGLTNAQVGLAVAGDANLTSVKTGTGSSVVDLSGEADSRAGFTFTAGTGNNVVLLGNSVTKLATFIGGTGSNVIGVTNGLTTTSGDTFSGFQTLEIGPNGNGFGSGIGGTGTYDLARLAGLKTVAITGDTAGNTPLTASVILTNAPDALSLVETASSGKILNTTPNFLGVLLGAGATTNNIHTASITLNANGAATDTKVLAPGVVTTGAIVVGQAPGNSATFLPGYAETLNLNSNILNPGGTATVASYTNSVGTLTATDATTINITGAAGLTIGGGGITASPNLTSVNAGNDTGAVTTAITLGTQTANFAYTGSAGVDNIAFSATNPPGTAATGVKFTNTFTGGLGNDQFNVTGDTGGDTFRYFTASDATMSDSGKNGVLIADAGSTLSVETIAGFDPSSLAAIGADTINLAPLGFANANVIVGGATGSNEAAAGITGTSLSGNLTNVANLFTTQGNGSGIYVPLSGANPASFTANAIAGTGAGAYVYQAADNSVYIFADANKDGNYGAASDLSLHLTGNFSAAQVNAIATDLKFA